MLNLSSLSCEKPWDISKVPRAVYSLRGKRIAVEMMAALKGLHL